MKNTHITAALAVFLSAITTQASIITNGNLETQVNKETKSITAVGTNVYFLDPELDVSVSSGVTSGSGEKTDTSANEWLWTQMNGGFQYSETGGVGGGGAFIANDQRTNPRAVGFFADDGKASTGLYDFSMDVYFDTHESRNPIFNVELYAWNDGDNRPRLTMGGAPPDNGDFAYNDSHFGDAVAILDNVQIASDSVTASTWTTISLGSYDLGGGYDFYAWRIGVVGADGNDDYRFDNVTAIPEPSSLMLMALAGLSLYGLRFRKNSTR
ncbi:MAG: PEP-CTERM sorting domain-containing protein [Verrucomicrobia bacterium]|nr:PEP-CTERM sorting domain-containing protein [Verrucomicrobiota bacterium]MCH8526987.1 PEP-CTERM sorting domain-containing protein [Kiritimatiellia bacterium]